MPKKGYIQKPAHTQRIKDAQLRKWAARRQWLEVSKAILEARSKNDTERASLLLNAYLEAHRPMIRGRLYNLAEEDED